MRWFFVIAPLLVLPVVLATSSAWANSLSRGDGESLGPDQRPPVAEQMRLPRVDDAGRRVRLNHRPDFVAEAGDIYDACARDAGDAAKKFAHKVIEVTGMIRRVSLSPPRLDLEERDRWFGGIVSCDFPANSRLANMADGETVTARGLFNSCAADATLTGCIMVHDPAAPDVRK